MNKDQLISDAIKITDIALASEDPIRARELVKSAMVENPFLGKIASAKLDTPLFIFRNMKDRELRSFLSKLKPTVLKWLWNYEKSSDQLRDFLSERLSENKKLDIELANESDFAGEDFYEIFSQEVENGRITFDTGLLFHTKITCPSLLEKDPSVIRIINVYPVIDSNLEAEFIVIGPPKFKGEFSVQLGNTAIYQESFTIGKMGFQRFSFRYKNFKNHLPSEDRNRSLILLSAVKNLNKKERPFECTSPFLFDPDFSLSRGSMPLQISLQSWYSTPEKIELDIKIEELHKQFSGQGDFTLRCVSCASTIGSRSIMAQGEALKLAYPTLGHKGPFVLCFAADKSGRKCSAMIPSVDFNPSSINEKESTSFMIDMKEIFIDQEFIYADIQSEKNLIYYYWLSPLENPYHPVLENITGLGCFPGNFPKAMSRAERFILFHEFGAPSHQNIACLPESAAKIKTIHILNTFMPGQYKLHVLAMVFGKPEYKSFEFAIVNKLKKMFPGALLPNDQVTANVQVGEKNPIEILDAEKNPMPCTSGKETRTYDLVCDGSKTNIFFVKLGNNGSAKIEPIEIVPLENPHRVVTVEAWSPVLDPNSLPDFEDRLTNDPHHVKDGQVLLLKDFTTRMALNLWDYDNCCAEQSSSRLFALGVLKHFEYPHFANHDSDKESFLLEKLEEYYSETSGLFTIWDKCPHDNRTTARVLRNLSIFQDTGHPAGKLLKRSLTKLSDKNTQLPSLAYFHKEFQDFENVSLFALWEKLWRAKKIEPYSPIWKRFLNYLFLKKNKKDIPVYINDYWSEYEFEAMRFYSAMILGKDSVNLKTVSRKKVDLTLFQKLLNTVKLAEYKEFEELETSEILSNPMENLQKNLSKMFYAQGGTSLFGNTPGSVGFIQALLGLHSLVKYKDLSFEKKIIQYDFSNHLNNNQEIKWDYPQNTWQKNTPQKLTVVVPVHGSYNALLEVFAPSHTKIGSIENGIISKDKTYAQVPFSGLTKTNVTLIPYLSGTADIQARVTSMYDINWGGALKKSIECK